MDGARRLRAEGASASLAEARLDLVRTKAGAFSRAMQFNPELTGEAASLARQHGDRLARLPATVHAFILTELQKWPTLFAPEQRYQRALLDHLSSVSPRDLDHASEAIARIEGDAGVTRLQDRDPSRFQDGAQALLRTRGLFGAWRDAVDQFFRTVNPVVEARLYPGDAPRRVIIQLYGSNITVQRDNLWRRFKGIGLRVPLNIDTHREPDRFLDELFGVPDRGGAKPMVFGGLMMPFDAWIIESNDALHTLCEKAGATASITGLSYDRLRGYRDELTRTLNRKIQNGVESPQAFAAYARSLQIAPPAGAMFAPSDVLVAFVRDVLLTGNGTLLMNNTFVEWAAIQALRRAQPRVLIARFGVRDKLKPFSSMVMFSQPRASDRIPIAPDPVGSFIDVEQLSYYVWLNAEKNPAYRKKTLYLFLAEGVDEMLAIRSDRSAEGVALRPHADEGVALSPARLVDVRATIAHWLGTPLPSESGRPIAELML